MLTGSGGTLEKSKYLGNPCLNPRPNAECPVTVTQGTIRLVIASQLPIGAANILQSNSKEARIPELWGGRTADCVVESVKRAFAVS